MTHPSQSGLLSGARRHAAVACVSVVFALLFALAEVTQASQGRFWFGGTAGQWIEAAAGFFLYTVALFLIAEVVSMLLGLASRRRLPYGACAATAGGGAALALWWLLRTSAVDGAQGPGAAVYLAIAGVTALLLVLPALRIVPLASLCAIGAAALLSGSGACGWSRTCSWWTRTAPSCARAFRRSGRARRRWRASSCTRWAA